MMRSRSIAALKRFATQKSKIPTHQKSKSPPKPKEDSDGAPFFVVLAREVNSRFLLAPFGRVSE